MSRSSRRRRLEALLLLALLAQLALWLTGTALRASCLERQFQANTAHRPVLSWLHLGLIAIREHLTLPKQALQQALRRIVTEAAA